MSEKKTKAPKAPATPAAPAQTTAEKGREALAKARAAREAAARLDKFVYVGNVKEGAKRLPPQAETIVNAVKASGKPGIARQDLVAALKGILQTRQPEGRIVSYYQKLMVARGDIRIDAAPKSEKPAKAAKAAAPASEDDGEGDGEGDGE